MNLSTREDLIPSIAGRPAVIKQDGWTIYVSIHDAGYLQKKKDFQAIIRASRARTHPDKFPQLAPEKAHARTIRAVQGEAQRFATWLHEERCWYWRLGLMPPDWRGPMTPPSGWRVSTNRRLTA